tara:strand:- start:1303 stop:3996 length:2694 start_codon:yes stop_codon:yes gene_type:complete
MASERPQRPANEIAGGTRASRENPYAPVSTTVAEGDKGKPEMKAYPAAPTSPMGDMQILQTQTNNAIRAAQASELDANRMASAFAGLSGTAMGIAELGVQAFDTFMKADRGVLSWQVEEREKMVADLAIANMSWAEMVEKGMIPETMSPNQTRAYMTYEAGRRDREFTTRVNSEMAMMLLDESNHTMDGFMSSMHKMWSEYMNVPVGGDEISFQYEMGKIWAKRSFEFGSRHSTWMQGNSKKQFTDGIRAGLITDFIQAEGAMEPLHNVPTGEVTVWTNPSDGLQQSIPQMRKETPEETQERVIQHVLGSIGATIQERWGHLHSFKTMHDEVGKALIDIAVKHPKYTGLALSVLDRLKVGPEGSELNIANRDAIKAYRSEKQPQLDRNTKDQNALTALQLFGAQMDVIETGLDRSIKGFAIKTKNAGELFTYATLFDDVDGSGVPQIHQFGAELAQIVSEQTGVPVEFDPSKMDSDEVMVFRSLDPRHPGIVVEEIKVEEVYKRFQLEATTNYYDHLISTGVPEAEAWAKAVTEHGYEGDVRAKDIVSATRKLSITAIDGDRQRAAVALSKGAAPKPDSELPVVVNFEENYQHWRALSQINPSLNAKLWEVTGGTLSVNTIMSAYDVLRNGTRPMNAGAAYEAIADFKAFVSVDENKKGVSSWRDDMQALLGVEMAVKPHLFGRRGEIDDLATTLYQLALSGASGSTLDTKTILDEAIKIVDDRTTFVGGTVFDVGDVPLTQATSIIPQFKAVFGEKRSSSIAAAMTRGQYPDSFTQEEQMQIAERIQPNLGDIIFKPAAGGRLWHAYRSVGGMAFPITPRPLTFKEWQSFKFDVADLQVLGSSSSMTTWQEGMVDPRISLMQSVEFLNQQGEPQKAAILEQQFPTPRKPGDMTPRP